MRCTASAWIAGSRAWLLVTSETAAWAEERNREQTGVDWQLSVDDARTKLKHLYQKIKTG